VNNEEEVNRLREDLKGLWEWAEKWQMGFNADKCKVMHMGRGNSEATYELGGKSLKVIDEEVDLGVIMSRDGKVSRQCAEAAKKGFNLERVQRRATRMVDECRGKSYEERLRCMKLTTLETRRIRADLIEVYKIVKGIDGLKESDFFTRITDGRSDGSKGYGMTRGNECKLYKRTFRQDVAKYTFGNRIVDLWNKLPKGVIGNVEGGVDAFKGRLDRVLSGAWGFV
jgi:hypothetical protein